MGVQQYPPSEKSSQQDLRIIADHTINVGLIRESTLHLWFYAQVMTQPSSGKLVKTYSLKSPATPTQPGFVG